MRMIENANPIPAGYGDDGTLATNIFGDLVPTVRPGYGTGTGSVGGSGGGLTGGGPTGGGTVTPPVTTPPATVPPATVPPVTPGATPSALDAWQQFYNSPAYQVPLNEGLEAVNTKYAAMGALESGAAMKAIDQFGADHAASALSTYMDDLYRQEALGASSASALAGVGQNLVGQVTSNNSAAASAAGNAQLQAGQASANGWNATGAAIGTAAGTIAGAFPSSYAPSSNNALANSGAYGNTDLSWMN